MEQIKEWKASGFSNVRCYNDLFRYCINEDHIAKLKEHGSYSLPEKIACTIDPDACKFCLKADQIINPEDYKNLGTGIHYNVENDILKNFMNQNNDAIKKTTKQIKEEQKKSQAAFF